METFILAIWLSTSTTIWFVNGYSKDDCETARASVTGVGALAACVPAPRQQQAQQQPAKPPDPH